MDFKNLDPKWTRNDLKGEAFLCDLSVLSSADYREVYEPKEDTYLLIDALNLESKFYLKNLVQEKINKNETFNILEIGVGSGAVITSLMMMIKRDIQNNLNFLKASGTDINPKAIDCAKRVSKKNDVDLELI